MSSSPSPGITGATLTPTSRPAAASRAIVLIRRCGVATNGSIARALSGSHSGTDTLTPTRATCASRESTSRSRSMSGALVMMPTGLRYSAHTSRQRRVSRYDASSG